jgi:hypothetical protein
LHDLAQRDIPIERGKDVGWIQCARYVHTLGTKFI